MDVIGRLPQLYFRCLQYAYGDVRMHEKPKRAKFTKSYVDKVRPGVKDAFHWDAEVKGFGLRVTPKGKLSFIV